MASAPTPGQQSASALIRIRVNARTLEMPAAVTLKEKMAVRLATGLPFEAFMTADQSRIGEDSLAVLWWLARRVNGEQNLAWQTAEQEWPTNLTADAISLEIVEDDGTSDLPES